MTKNQNKSSQWKRRERETWEGMKGRNKGREKREKR